MVLKKLGKMMKCEEGKMFLKAGVEVREGRLGMREAEVEERMGEVAVGEEALRKDRSVLKGRLMDSRKGELGRKRDVRRAGRAWRRRLHFSGKRWRGWRC